MNEILIDDRKYISSKRAAEITGYAKDYIGQLCREGRVPARLIGRSWYVLETAIHDHRFGKQKIEAEPSQTIVPNSDLQATWESPRYEASPVETFLSQKTDEYPLNKTQVQGEVPKNLQDSWHAWFNGAVKKETDSFEIHEDVKKEEFDEKQSVVEEEEISVPIHTLHGQPPRELLPRRNIKIEFPMPNRGDGLEDVQRRNGREGVLRVVRVFGSLLAAISIILAVINTGYFDNYLISYSQVYIISGISLYSK